MKMKNRQQLLVILTLVVVGAFAGERLLYEPLKSIWDRRAQEIARVNKQVSDGNLLLRGESSLRTRWEQMRTNTLPNSRSLAEQQVLGTIDRWVRSNHISTTEITPQWKQRDTDEFMTLECHVNASGDLYAITRFLFDIEKDPLALKLEAVELGSRDNEGQQISLGLTLSGLVLTTPQPQ
jgi:hypothetical protein